MKNCLFLLLLILSQGAAACPFCNSYTASKIRTVLFGYDFFTNIIYTLLPFIILWAIIYFVYYHPDKFLKSFIR